MPIKAETDWYEQTIRTQIKVLKVIKEKIAKESIITIIPESG